MLTVCTAYSANNAKFIRQALRPFVSTETNFNTVINPSGTGAFALYDPLDRNILIVGNFNVASETLENSIAFILPSYGVTGDIEYLNCTINDTGYRIISFHSVDDNTVRVLRYDPATGWVNAIPAIYTSTAVISNNYVKLANNGAGLIVFQESTGTTNTGSILTFVTTDFGATWTQITFSDTAVRLRDPHIQERFTPGHIQSDSLSINQETGQAILIYGGENPILLRNPAVRAAVFTPDLTTPANSAWSAPTLLSDGTAMNTTSFNRVIEMNNNGHAAAAWLTVDNNFPHNSIGYLAYYNGSEWATPIPVTNIIPAPGEISTDIISVALNNNNHAVAVWASTQEDICRAPAGALQISLGPLP